MSKLTKDQVRPLVEQYVHARLEDFTTANAVRMQDEIRATIGEELLIDKAKHPFWAMLKELRVIYEERRKDRNRAIISRGEAFLKNEGFTDFLESPEFSHFCVGISTAEKKFLNYFLAILNERRNPEQRLQELLDIQSYHPRLPGISHSKKTVAVPQADATIDSKLISLPLSKVVDKYLTERREAWKDSTSQEYPSVLREFVEIVRDIDSTQLSKANLLHYKEVLQKLPKGRGRKAEFKSKSISDVLRMTYDDMVSSKTVNKRLLIVSGMLRWAADCGYCASNFSKGLQIKLPKQNPRDARCIWTKEELAILFSAETYPLNGPAHMFWLPILGLLTGARIDELSQLRPNDIRLIDDIWCLDINDEGSKRLKTTFSKRVVPLHPFLVNDLKFPQYAQRMSNSGASNLFPELFGHKSECRKIASSHFSKFIHKKLGIVNEKLTFHSLRHTVKQYLVNAGVEKVMRNDLGGWRNEDVSDGVYGTQTPPKVLLKFAVTKIPLEVDCAFLKTSPWVTGVGTEKCEKKKAQVKRITWKGEA